MIKLNKTQQKMLDGSLNGKVVVPFSMKLRVKQAYKLVQMGVLKPHNQTKYYTSYKIVNLSD